MRTSDKFPWELLKAECLRLVCAQLIEASNEGHNTFKPGRKEEMIAFLHDVHEHGVLKALQVVEPPNTTKRSVSSAQKATPSKRKSPPVEGEEDAEGDSDKEDEEGYNTRYKGVKRVKVHGPSPEPQEPKQKRKVGRPRKSVPVEGGRKRGRPRKNVLSSGEEVKASKGKGKPLENDEAVVVVAPSISRPRGRPRKNGTVNDGASKHGSGKKPRKSTNVSAPWSRDSGREVFDGIVLVKRSKSGKEKAAGDDEGVAANDRGEGPTGINGEGDGIEEDGIEEDAVLAAVNGVGDLQGDLSSLGGSNKENEISATYTPDPEEGQHEIDMDADGEFDAEV